MAAITQIADQFFVACEAGKGWDVCKAYCTPNATFGAQAEPLVDVKSLQQYCDWMKGLWASSPTAATSLSPSRQTRNGATSRRMPYFMVRTPAKAVPSHQRAKR